MDTINWVGELTDDAGRVVDSHTLRTKYITLLVKGGTSVKVAQELARHSNPKLTMNVYSKLGVHDLAGALDMLPSLTADARVRMRTTGTDHVRAEASTDPAQTPIVGARTSAKTRDRAHHRKRDDTIEQCV